MRLEVLSYLVLRLVVGSYMIGHAIVNVVMFRAYSEKLELIQNSVLYFDNPFFFIAAPLFPFIEFFLGVLVLMSFYYKKALVVGLLVYSLASVGYCYAGAYTGRNVIYVTLILIIFLLISIQYNHYNTPNSQFKSNLH